MHTRIIAAGSNIALFSVFIAANTTVAAGPSPALQFQQRTSIVNDSDVSTFLGSPDHNFARTKDADIADIDGDGRSDILDANSNNGASPNNQPPGNGTDIIVRINNGNGFTSHVVGPRDDRVSYDADLVLLDDDNLPDLIRTEGPPCNLSGNPGCRANQARTVSVYRNRGEAGGWFDLSDPDFTRMLDLCPDDIAYGDLNRDGLVDFAVTERIGRLCDTNAAQISQTAVFLAQGNGLEFAQQVNKLPAAEDTFVDGIARDQSTHDVFFLDANNDGDLDIFTVNESVFIGQDAQGQDIRIEIPGRFWLNGGGGSPTFTIGPGLFPKRFVGSVCRFR